MKQFRATPFWQAWDPEALDRYVECGLCDDPKGGVKLKMSGMLVSRSVVSNHTNVVTRLSRLGSDRVRRSSSNL